MSSRTLLTDHLAIYVRPEPEALIIPGPLGGPLRRGNFNRQSGAVAAIGTSGLHFHDLRHTGNAWAAVHRPMTASLEGYDCRALDQR